MVQNKTFAIGTLSRLFDDLSDKIDSINVLAQNLGVSVSITYSILGEDQHYFTNAREEAEDWEQSDWADSGCSYEEEEWEPSQRCW